MSPSGKKAGNSEWQSNNGKPGQCADLNIQNGGSTLQQNNLLNENRMIKSSHPLFEGGTAEVARDRLCVPRANKGCN